MTPEEARAILLAAFLAATELPPEMRELVALIFAPTPTDPDRST